MKERLLSGWTFTRALYLLMGSIILVQSVVEHQIMGVIFGTYFASMGLFAFGCAAGNCAMGPQSDNTHTEDVSFEEIKSK